VFGIRLLFVVSGVGGYFSFIPLFVNIGSGLGLLSLATLITDKLMIWLCPGKDFYKKHKYDDVPPPDTDEERIPLNKMSP